MKLTRLFYSATVPLSIFLATLVTVHGDSNQHHSKYCKDEKCEIAAKEILLSLNRSVKPCDDFYGHVCRASSEDSIYPLMLKVKADISELINDAQSSDIEALKKSKKFYDACMDSDAIERRGLKPIERILTDNGEWPVTVPSDKWNNRNLTWQEIHKNFAKRVSVSALFDITVQVDRDNSSVYVLWLSAPTVTSVKEKFDGRNTDYKKKVVGIVEVIRKSRGFDVTHDDLLAECQGIVEFEEKLYGLSISLNEDEDDLRVTTIETLQNDWDAAVPRNSKYSLNWLKTINDRFEGTGIVIDASEKIVLSPGAIVADLARALVDTPVRTIANYIHWKVVDYLLPLTSANTSDPSAPHAVPPNRSENCISGHKMIHALTYMYVKRHLSVESRTAALEIVQQIQDEMKREVSNSSWLDDATKSLAREKIDAIKTFMGYPEWYNESGKIDEYYRELTVGPDYFNNVLVYDKFAVKKQFSKFRSPVIRSETEWVPPPHVVNALYTQGDNCLTFTAAMLQSPMFVYERSSVLNYGSLGSIVGHEISHGFDNTGRLYDKDGKKRKWWTQSTLDTYTTKAQCFVEQYNKYTFNGINNTTVHVNGAQTQGENIADTIAYRAGLRAYQRARNDGKTNNVKIRLLNNVTDEQLYFYELAYILCESESDLAIYVSNPHSPSRARITGGLSNMQEFADAFNCPPGSPMNQSKKCLIWD